MNKRERHLAGILADIVEERQRQDEKWGDQHWPDGTIPARATLANAARWNCDQRFKNGSLAWYHILREEFLEAGAETEWLKLRAELIQVAAVCVAWIEDGDQR